MYRKFGKRMLDLVLTLPFCVVLSPLALVIALLVRINLGSPVIFRQARPGQGGRLFTIYKFRTMTNARSASGELLPDAERLTPFGNFLRTTSLDELPEMLNVVRDEMSLVGPRPLMATYLERYTPEQMRRHEVMPGLTGWAQVNGRNALSWEEKFTLDLQYVNDQSISLDLRIILMTLREMASRRGVSAPSHATMPEFAGPSVLEDKMESHNW
jgi:sugar transferase EpsL